MIAKVYNVKIYTLAGEFVATFSPSEVMNEINFTSQINGGQGELRVKLNTAFTNAVLAYNQVVKVYEISEASPTGRLIYVGLVGSIHRVADSSSEYIEIRSLGLASLLLWTIYDPGGAEVTTKTGEPCDIAKDIIDRFSIRYPGLIWYDSNSFETLGSTISIDVKSNNGAEAMAKIIEKVGATFFWRIGQDGKIIFWKKTSAQIPNHIVTIGDSAEMVDLEENTEGIVNYYKFTYDNGSSIAQDAASQATYGIRVKHETKSGTAYGQAAADAVTADYVAKNKDKKNHTIVTINSNYDLGSIQPGDKLSVENFS